MLRRLINGPKLILTAMLALSSVIVGCHQSADPALTAALTAVKQGAVLIDVRADSEFQSGHLAGAINMPHTTIVDQATRAGFAQDRDIVVYCRSGNRSGIAKASLEAAGFSRVTNAGAYEDLLRLQTAGAAP